MGLQEFFRDAKNILLGNTENDNQPDFKEELENAIKAGIVTKAEATQLIQTIKNIKSDAKEMDKKQISSISLEDGTIVSYEEAKAKKEELERKKRKKAEMQRTSLENSVNLSNNEGIKVNKQSVNNAKKVNKNKLQIDKNKMIKEMQKDEMRDIQTKDIERDGKN